MDHALRPRLPFDRLVRKVSDVLRDFLQRVVGDHATVERHDRRTPKPTRGGAPALIRTTWTDGKACRRAVVSPASSLSSLW